MAFGKPVLTTAVGQNAEYLTDGESGLLTPSGDEEAYGKGLDRLLQDGDLRSRLGQNARRRLVVTSYGAGVSRTIVREHTGSRQVFLEAPIQLLPTN